MNHTELLAAYAEVARKHRLPAMESSTVTVAAHHALTPGPSPAGGRGESDAWEWLRELAPREGWLQFQSRVVAFADGALPQPSQDWGMLLAAEAVLADGRSLSLRPDGRGALHGALFTHGPGGTVAEGGMTVEALADRVRHRATGRVPGAAKALHYARYWHLDPERGSIPFLAAFDGFGHPEE
jgi:hypothetical protein